MLFLILTFIVIALVFLLLHSMDKRRWHRYKFERDMFFRSHPYILHCNEKFEIELHVTNTMQRKLLSVLTLKSDQLQRYRTATILRDADQYRRNSVKVMLCDLTVAHLEPYYAEKFCKSLAHTDFSIGRPIEVSAEILLSIGENQTEIQDIRIDLPLDPTQANQYLVDKTGSKKLKAKNSNPDD